MRYKPEQKNARLVRLIIVGFAMAAAVGYLGSLAVGKYGWIFQTVIVLAVVAALYMWSRYTLTWFCYVFPDSEEKDTDNELIVYKGQGRKEGVMEAKLPMASLIEVVPVTRGTPVGREQKKSWKEYARTRYLGCDCYDYTKTFLWQEATVYIFHYGDRHIALLLEIDPSSASVESAASDISVPSENY